MEYNIPKLPKRPENSNKGTFGKILNIAGSEYMPGAAYLSSVAALKTGAGYLELASDEKTLRTVSEMLPEAVLVPKEKIEQYINIATVISIGCGLSTEQEAVEIFKKVINNRKNLPTVIDADGLNILSNNPTEFDKNTILTPHPKEASRLLNCKLEDILKDTENSAKEISEKYNCITVLKTHNTTVTDGKIIYINKTGSSALSKAGTGDILCGMISGLLAQNMKPFDAAILGVYLHGLAGELASRYLTEYSVLASELVRYIPNAIKSVSGS